MECGLLYVRLTPIAAKLCVAAKFRDVPILLQKSKIEQP
jgi:hypothetical protein